MNIDEFIGREAEVRTIATNIEAGHSTLVIGDEGVGKTALLQIVHELLEDKHIIFTERVAPFGSFLRDVFTGLWDNSLIPDQSEDLEDDLKAWGKQLADNNAKAKYLCDLIAELENVVVMIDDASGITPTSRPHLEQLVENCTVVAAIHPKALDKNGSKRFWKRFDEMRLERLSKAEAEQLFEVKAKRYKVTADEPEVYKRKVLGLAQGSPFELERLIKYHLSQSLVKTKELGNFSHSFVERDEKGVAIAPILLVGLAFMIAARYIARAQGNLDLYVISGIAVAMLFVVGPWIRSSIKPKAR